MLADAALIPSGGCRPFQVTSASRSCREGGVAPSAVPARGGDADGGPGLAGVSTVEFDEAESSADRTGDPLLGPTLCSSLSDRFGFADREDASGGADRGERRFEAHEPGPKSIGQPQNR